MERNIALARKLGHLKCKEKTVQYVSRGTDKHPASKSLILCTGTQGEELAALPRMGRGEHAQVKLRTEDTVIFSSSVIPGNELEIVKVLNNLAEKGVRYLDYKKIPNLHTGGHGNAGDCRLLVSLLKPHNFAPIHGELFMRYGHRDMIVDELNFPREKTFIMKNGLGTIISSKGIRLMNPQDQMPQNQVYLQQGTPVTKETIDERHNLSEFGIIIASISHQAGTAKQVTLRSRGFPLEGKFAGVLAKIEKNLKDDFSRLYDAARPVKALETTLKSNLTKFIVKEYHFDPRLEIIIN
jgi:ribonuclease J